MIRSQKGTFVIDALILLPWFFGPLVVYLSVRYLYRWFSRSRKKYIIPVLALYTLKVFWIIAVGLYFDFWRFWFLSDLSGNDFMWNWPFNLIGVRLVSDIPTYLDFWGFWNLIALFLFFVVYPASLWIGIQIGYILFGRSERQKGAIDLLFPFNKKSQFE